LKRSDAVSAIKDEWLSEDGSVRLILGDCRDVMPLLGAGAFDAVIVDPAYQSLDVYVATGTTTRLVRLDKFAGKRLASSNGRSWFSTIPSEELPNVFADARRLLCETGVMYVFADVKTGLDVFPILQPQNVIVWDKCKIGMGYSWRRMHEWIAYCPMAQHKLRDASLGDIIRCRGVEEKCHPTEKPVDVIVPLLENSTDRRGVVLDFNLGSGTTAVACVRTGRCVVGIESDREWFDVAVSRVQAELSRFPLFEPQRQKQAGLFDDPEPATA
jgi:site-specific DNA-methyltransferase (adenine-specific)